MFAELDDGCASMKDQVKIILFTKDGPYVL